MAPEANPFEPVGGFENPCKRLNDDLIEIYNQINQRKEEVNPSYVTLLNCNVLTNITRTIVDVAPTEVPSGVPLPPEPKITLDFSEGDLSMDLNFNIYPPLSGSESDQTVYAIIVEAAKYWNVDMSQETPGSTEFWQTWAQVVNRAAIILEGDLVTAMRKGRQGTQAIHDFIPKPGIFISVPTNAASGLISAEGPEGPIGEGPGGDFPEPAEPGECPPFCS
tara:strand:+ start:4010 stop:4672 length:663 start_codon:yes stop_codon:yes gene_type:complete